MCISTEITRYDDHQHNVYKFRVMCDEQQEQEDDDDDDEEKEKEEEE